MTQITNSTVVSRIKYLKMNGNSEMDEYAPMRLAFLSFAVLFGVFVYVFFKIVWSPRRSRLSTYERLKADDLWSASLLENQS